MKRIVLMFVIAASPVLGWAQLNEEVADTSWKKVYRESYARVNNLVHTKLDVKFDYDKLPKNGLKIDIGASVVEANTNQKKEIQMKFEDVKAQFANELKALTDEAYANGVKAENQRLKEIDDLEVSGHKNLVITAKYGETTVNAGILAMNVLKADKEAKAKLMANIQDDANEIQPTVNKTDAEGQEPENNDEAKLNEYNALFAKAATSIKR